MARTASAPSRLLLVVTLGVVLVMTALRLAFAARLDLRSDEAYYWTWSQQWALSYLDHPPMVAWFERLGQAVFGNTTLGARFAQIAALPLIELLLGDVARRRTGSWNAALVLVVVLECSPYYGVNIAIIEPSIPLLLLVSLMLWALCRLDETADPRWWLLVGLAAGFAGLSKYLLVFLAPPLLFYVLLSRDRRRELLAPWPWLGLVVAVLALSPVLIWNIRHDWISVAFQSSRLGSGQGFGIIHLLYFLVLDTVGVGLVLSLAAIVGSIVLGVRSLRAARPFEVFVAAAFLFPLGFFLVRSLSYQINMSWAYFVWPIGSLALVMTMRWESWSHRGSLLLAGVAVTGLPISLGLIYHATLDNRVWLNGVGDPIGMDAGFDEMSQKVLADARASSAKWIATTEYRTYANLLWHIGNEIPVVQVNERARFLDFDVGDPARFTGRALYVHAGPAPALLAGAQLAPYEQLQVRWRGVPVSRVTVETLDGFVPELNPAPGTPSYVASN